VKRLTIILAAFLCGCGNRVVFVPPAGVATRVGPSISGRIYTYDPTGKWVLSGAAAAYPEGYYLVAPPRGATTLPARP
jgi:hypothetical protein